MKISRRTLLRGAGVGLSLPWLEAMMPSSARAQSHVAIFPAAWPLRNYAKPRRHYNPG